MTSPSGAASPGEPTPYTVLGVPASATAEEITRAYRLAVRGVHPDLVSYPDPSAKSDAIDRLRRLNEAYAELTRDRPAVDRRLNETRGSAGSGARPPTRSAGPTRPVVRLSRRDWEIGRTVLGGDGVRLTVPPRTPPGPFRPFDRGRRVEVDVVHVDARGEILPDGHEWDVDHLARVLSEPRRARRWWHRR